jgi:hypothetical protein
MAKFLDSKERVLDLRLTSYGKYLLSVGKFKPYCYAFFDDNVIYDGKYANINESQNAIHSRIKKETPYLESMVHFEEVEKQSEIRQDPALTGVGSNRLRLAQEYFEEMSDYATSYKVLGYGPEIDYSGPFGPDPRGALEAAAPAAAGAGILDLESDTFEADGASLTQVPVVNFFHGDVFPTEYLPRKDIFKIDQAIGDASLSSLNTNTAPAWKVVVLNGKIKNFESVKARMDIMFDNDAVPTAGQRFTLTDIDANTQEFEFVNSVTTDTYSRSISNGRVRISIRGLTAGLPTTIETLLNRIALSITGAQQEGLINISVLGTVLLGDPLGGSGMISLEQYRGGTRGNIDHSSTLASISGVVHRPWGPRANKFAGGLESSVDIKERDSTFPSGSNNIPQINIEVDYQKNVYSKENLSVQFGDPSEIVNRTGLFLDDKYVQVDSQNPMVYIDEVNTEIMNKNFEVEVFMITGSSDNIGYNKDGVWGHIEPTYQLIKKFFASPKDQIVDGRMMTNHPYDYNSPDINTTSVEYYFNFLKDSQTNKEIACKQIQEYNKSSYYIDLDLDCAPDSGQDLYNDIYGSEVVPEICLD